ncbi:hypothetical protein [Paenibacillus sp. FSL H8-0259]|uniref:hypothetical protein n=1 Tax=Paenibacillus sp. FSL H8-0259 TaxID=1920423 RepID=UPI0015C3E069|nr:hypothetical protein [Paenibacillus sp. FSL H8-0259]
MNRAAILLDWRVAALFYDLSAWMDTVLTVKHLNAYYVVRITTLAQQYQRIRKDCCTIYSNFPGKSLVAGEMLLFIQHFWILAELGRGML